MVTFAADMAAIDWTADLDVTPPPFEILRPARQRHGIVLASPHSGRAYPADFVAASRLDPVTLRTSEDSFVDELFATGPGLGVPLIRATFPRAYVDANREPFELDPEMFDDRLPDHVVTDSPRVQAGLGTVARIVANGEAIYDHKLRFSEAKARIDRCYHPYHRALRRLVDDTLDRFGHCVLLDCHSMPSGASIPSGRVSTPHDFVIGDRHGVSCNPALSRLIGAELRARGYDVAFNTPYAGGFTTRHYGAPERGLHGVQLEINRKLYMDEHRIERRPRAMDALASDLARLLKTLAAFLPELAAR